jgi:acetyltransferase-like isoleucine patch superfamily enzyme
MGRDCFLGARTMIDSGVCIGDRVVLEGGSHLFSGVIIEDDVSIGTNTTFARTRERDQATPTLVSSIILRHHCSIGANATLSSGITIGEYALVHAGAVVMHSVQPHAIVSGNPAEVIGFANTVASIAGAPPSTSSDQPPIVKSKVQGVASYQLPLITDPRGNLIVGEFERTLPFIPKRYFMTFDVPNTKLRGEHAHKNCEQFLICIRGSCAVVVDDGIQREEFQLNQPTFGIHLPAMIWSTEYKHSADSLLMAFASDYYDPDDYIRDYQTFLSAKKESLA